MCDRGASVKTPESQEHLLGSSKKYSSVLEKKHQELVAGSFFLLVVEARRIRSSQGRWGSSSPSVWPLFLPQWKETERLWEPAAQKSPIAYRDTRNLLTLKAQAEHSSGVGSTSAPCLGFIARERRGSNRPLCPIWERRKEAKKA